MSNEHDGDVLFMTWVCFCYFLSVKGPVLLLLLLHVVLMLRTLEYVVVMKRTVILFNYYTQHNDKMNVLSCPIDSLQNSICLMLRT